MILIEQAFSDKDNPIRYLMAPLHSKKIYKENINLNGKNICIIKKIFSL